MDNLDLSDKEAVTYLIKIAHDGTCGNETVIHIDAGIR